MFIEGFESPFGLELLATIDFITQNTKIRTLGEIRSEIKNWTNRKQTLIKDHHIELALQRLKEFNLI